MISNLSKTIWFPKKETCQIKKFNVKPSSKKDFIIIKSIYSLISQGTEKIFFKDNIPKETSHLMTVPYQLNNGKFPCNYGYSLVGKVIEGSELWLNQYVHVLHPHANYAYVNKKHCTLLPKSIDLTYAPLISQIQTAITAIWDSKILFGDRILIVGFGLIGACIACLLKSRVESEIFILEPNPARQEIAKKCGFKIASYGHSKEDIDLAFYCTSNTDSLLYSMKRLVINGKLIHCGWTGTDFTNIQLGSFFHSKRIQWISSQVSNFPNHIANHWSIKKRNDLALLCLNESVFNQFSINKINFNTLGSAYKNALNNDSLIQLICYD